VDENLQQQNLSGDRCIIAATVKDTAKKYLLGYFSVLKSSTKVSGI